MYLIQNDLGLYFSGEVCGIIVWKNHHTRAVPYSTKDAAYSDIKFYYLEDESTVVPDPEEYGNE